MEPDVGAGETTCACEPETADEVEATGDTEVTELVGVAAGPLANNLVMTCSHSTAWSGL